MMRFGAVLLFILFFNLFLFYPWGPVAHVSQRIGFLVLLLALFHRTIFHASSINGTLTYIAVLGISCIGLILRSSSFPTFLLHATSLVTLLLFLYEYTVTTYAIRSLMELCLIPLRTGFEYLNSVVRILAAAFAAKESRQTASSTRSPYRHMARSLLVGILLGLPAVFILSALFSSADPIFGKFIEQSTRWLQNLLNADTWERLIARAVLSFVLFGMLAPLLYFVRKPVTSSLPYFARYQWTTELTVALCMIAITVGTFLVIQWPYVFVNVPFETDLSQFGVATYSEYVTKGFFELVAASFFLYGVLWIVHILTREQPMRDRQILRIMQAGILALFVLLIISVFRRVYLYQSYHGWSLARIYGSFGLLWISVLTTTFAGRLITQRRWVTIEIGATAFLILFAGLWNAEQFIVRTHPPTVNKRIDYVYLSRLSADGTEGWQQAYTYAQTTLLSESMTQKEVLDADDRRNIAYAGTIVSNLTREYDRLISIYGSDEERTAYYEAMLRPFFVRPKDFNAAEGAQLLRSLETASIDHTAIRNRLYPNRWWEEVVFETPAMSLFYFYSVQPVDTSRQPLPDGLGQLFLWNRADAHAYQMLKKDIGPVQLAALQEAFYLHYDRILTQPENEREYEHDLSFRSPFLE